MATKKIILKKEIKDKKSKTKKQKKSQKMKGGYIKENNLLNLMSKAGLSASNVEKVMSVKKQKDSMNNQHQQLPTRNSPNKLSQQSLQTTYANQQQQPLQTPYVNQQQQPLQSQINNSHQLLQRQNNNNKQLKKLAPPQIYNYQQQSYNHNSQQKNNYNKATSTYNRNLNFGNGPFNIYKFQVLMKGNNDIFKFTVSSDYLDKNVFISGLINGFNRKINNNLTNKSDIIEYVKNMLDNKLNTLDNGTLYKNTTIEFIFDYTNNDNLIIKIKNGGVNLNNNSRDDTIFYNGYDVKNTLIKIFQEECCGEKGYLLRNGNKVKNNFNKFFQ
jgi:hypothetical protein